MRYISILTILFLSGCASIVSSDLHKVSIESNEPDVNYVITNRKNEIIAQGKTPATVDLVSSYKYFSGEKYTVKAHKEGFSDNYRDIDSSLSNWYLFGNIIFGGLIGWFIVDPLTGAMYTLPDKVSVPIEK